MSSVRPVRATIDMPWAARAIRRAKPYAWLAITGATIALPSSVLAATPTGTAGGPSSEPEVSLLSRLLDIAVPLVAIAVVLAVLIGLAVVVARLAGPPVAPASVLGPPESKASRRSLAMWLSVLVTIGALVVGVLAGREIAYERSVGGLEGVLGGAILIAFLVVAVVGLVAVGLIATTIRHGHVSRAIGTMLAAAGFLTIGAFGGGATAGAAGGLYHQPVVLQATGQAHVELQAGAVPFVARDGGRAECRSVPDGSTVADVTALELGKLGSGGLRATVSLPAAGSYAASAEFWIDGADVLEGSIQPFWQGSVQFSEISADGASGRLTFNGLEQENGAGKPAAESSSPTSATDWPSTITGTLDWTCQPW